MPDIRKIKLPNVITPYKICDDEARYDIHYAGAVNFLPIDSAFANGEMYGITYTRNSDDTVKVNGTAENEVSIYYGSVMLPAGVYMFSGCPANGSTNSYFMTYNFISGSTYRDYIEVTGDPYGYELNTEMEVEAWIVIEQGTTVNNLVYKPMISTSIKEYAPYAMTNKQITDALRDGVASAISELTDVELTNLDDNDVLVYDETNEEWKNEAGHMKTVELTSVQYEALTTAQKNDPHIVYLITDRTAADVVIDDTTTSTGAVWSSDKVSDEIDARIGAAIDDALSASY